MWHECLDAHSLQHYAANDHDPVTKGIENNEGRAQTCRASTGAKAPDINVCHEVVNSRSIIICRIELQMTANNVPIDKAQMRNSVARAEG